MSYVDVEMAGVDVRVKFGDYRSKISRDICRRGSSQKFLGARAQPNSSTSGSGPRLVLGMTLNCLHRVICLPHPGANDLSC